MTAPVIPGFLGHLPVCPRTGLPILASSARRADGSGQFGVNDPRAKLVCAMAGLCGICGHPFDGGELMVFLTVDPGPGAVLARLLFPDPPNHERCAAAAMVLCPFIARPAMTRSGRRRAEAKPGWLAVYTASYEIGPGRGPVLFTFRPGPLTGARRYAYDDAGALTGRWHT